MIGVTMGDANGVGPEIILRAHSENKIPGPYIVIGDFQVMKEAGEKLAPDLELNKINDIKDLEANILNVLDLGILRADDLTVGRISGTTGKASLEYITRATHLALEGIIECMITLPVNKEAIRLTDNHFTGHTDHIAAICGVKNSAMMLVSEKLIVTHISTHTALRNAIELIEKNRIFEVIRMTHEAIIRLGRNGSIAVAGLNPHAGENGAFGMEEIREIAPAVKEAREMGMPVEGPLPPDTVFYQAVQGKYVAVVCMYHDQGHIPLKLLAFDNAVNITLGLPIIRTSVDHGTAYDIAWKGKASIKSFCNAIALAMKLVNSQRQV